MSNTNSFYIVCLMLKSSNSKNVFALQHHEKAKRKQQIISHYFFRTPIERPHIFVLAASKNSHKFKRETENRID